jgi:RHS repeat-associated protein
VTDQSGSKSVEKRSYDAFGARRNPQWGAAPVAFSSLTTRGFTGHEDDEELGLINMKGRLYDPKVGRFLTTDPLVSHPGFGQSWNPYSYVFNNPLAFTDPSGFQALPVPDIYIARENGSLQVWRAPMALPPPPPPSPPPPPNVDASLAGLSTVPVDLNATGNKAASTPQTPPDGGGESGGAGQNLALSAGGGGADSGALTQAALHPQDYLAMQQDMNQQGRLYGLAAALALLKSPVVVGIVAFGLFNPDPAYAPTFQTVPEDRPSVLERAGETGLAVVVGAIGIKLGQVGSVAAESTVADISISRTRYAQAAAHIQDAQTAGHPSLLTIARGGAATNRAASTGGYAKVPGMQLDEYPPAMFREGGRGASVRPIDPRQNMGAGACIGNACRGLPNGRQVRILVVD